MTKNDRELSEVKAVIQNAGFSISQVAKALDTSPQNLHKKLSNGTLDYTDFLRILEHIGYKAILLKATEAEASACPVEIHLTPPSDSLWQKMSAFLSKFK